MGGRIILLCYDVLLADNAYRIVVSSAPGPALVPRVKRELALLLSNAGFESVQDAVGVDAGRTQAGDM